MGKTAFQKIVERHLLRTLPDGRLVLGLDRVWGHEITTPNAILDMQMRGCDAVFNPNRIKTMIDHVSPAKDTASAVQGKIIREWSHKHGIEFLDVGRGGVCHAVIPEMGWIFPGEIGIMGDSHTCTHGAFCAFTAGVGTTELENGIITGLWVCPPQKIIRVNFTGKLPANVFAKDLILTLINKIGVKGATNAVLEFGGNVIDEMSMEGRMTITNMSVEAGATSGMMMVDKRMIDYFYYAFRDNAFDRDVSGLFMQKHNSDPDAIYDQTINIDVTGMHPVITVNYSPGDVVSVLSLAGKKIDQVYIGSCTNGRIEDLRIAAHIMKQYGGKISDNIRCIVVPATQHIYERALQEGLIETFINAGCYVSGPTCGACLGMSCGVMAPGEVCVSTTNRNFPGRMGKDSLVHLVSPATAATTAMSGMIMEPNEKFCRAAIDNGSRRPIFDAVKPTEWKEKTFLKPDYAKLLDDIGGGKEKRFFGEAFYLPIKNVDTDQIIPAKYLTETKKEEFGKHCLEDAPISPADKLALQKRNYEILVTGENFGCGSSREHAPWALESARIKCVIAPSFARIFENNMFANGLLCITLPEENIQWLFENKPKKIEVDIDKGEIYCGNLEEYCGIRQGINMTFKFALSAHQKELIKNGGSVGVMLKIAAELQTEGKI